MTTPSAAYSPEGSGGIINLIMKTPNRDTTTTSLSAQYGGAGGTRFSGSYSRRAGKWSITGSANRNNDAVTGWTHTVRSASSAPGATLVDSLNDYRQSSENTSTQASLNATYDATPTLQLTANASGSRLESSGSVPIEQILQVFSAGVPVNGFSTKYDGFNNFTTAGYGAGVTQKFQGQEHDLSVTYNFSRNGRTAVFDSTITQFVPSPALSFDETLFNAVSRQQFVRANYRRPMKDGAKLRVGYELQADDNDYNNHYARGPMPGALVVDPGVASLFAFRQTVNSVFGTVERGWGALNAQLGLRAEAVDMRIAQTIERDYLRTYPTLNFGYKIDDAYSLRGGYSRRVQRPSPASLNPFRTQNGPLFFGEGNPDLQPQVTDSFEVSYQYRKAQTSYLATLYWRLADNEFVYVSHDLGGGATLGRQENLWSSRSAGIEFVANGRLASTLRYSLNATPYWKEVDAGNLGFVGKRSAFGVGGNGSLNWDPTAKDALQLNVTATGKRLGAQGYQLAVWSLNLGWRHKLSDRISSTFTVRDALDTTYYKEVNNTPVLRSISVAHLGTNRAVFLQLSYAFGSTRPSEPAFDYGGN